MFPNRGEFGSVHADHTKLANLRFLRREPTLHEELIGGANLAKATKVEQGKSDHLRMPCAMSWNDRRDLIISAHALRSDRV